MDPALFSSKRDNWRTPQWLFDLLDREFHFTVDVASDDLNYKCIRHYTLADNGLLHSWSDEVVFCNPPYGRNSIYPWVEKAYNTCRCSTSTVVLLLPARTDTAWFHDYVIEKAEVRFIRGRLCFDDSGSRAPFPSMIVVFRSS